MGDAPRTWVLTSSPDNHAATAAHAFSVIGMKERRRNQALQMEPGDRIVLDEPQWVTAESLKDDLAHIRKWPAEHWKLAFQGQLRTVSEADAALLMDRMHAASGIAA